MGLVKWNDGAPTALNVRGSGNKKRLEMPDGTTRMGNVTADPDDDIYETKEAGAKPDRYQVAGAVTLDNDGWSVTYTRSVSYKPLADIQTMKVADAKKNAMSLLSKDDWMTAREHEEPGKPIPPDIKTWRAAIRQQADDFEAAVNIETDAATVAAMDPAWPIDPREV